VAKSGFEYEKSKTARCERVSYGGQVVRQVRTRIVHAARVSSTQDMAREMMPRELGTVIVADAQEKGRGRRGHVWLSPRGGLYASIILRSDPLLSLRVGVAVARALQQAGIVARLKWPNDVLVAGKKIAGILIEVADGTAIVGIGVNIDSAPLSEATCIVSETRVPITRDALLHSILQEIKITYEEDIIEAYRVLCATLGRRVRVSIAAGNEVTGIALGIDRDGHLLVDDGEATRTIVGGDCVHLGTGV